jgi:gag-polypeptide of LTR copia-type
MTEPMFSFPDPNQTTQISTVLRPNADFNSSQKLTNVPLNGKNYIPWAKAARVTFKGKGLLGYVNESRIRPSEGAEAQDEWDMIDSQVMTLILNSLEPQLSETFYCKIANELWQAIENQFNNKNNHSLIYQLKREIAQISQDSKDIQELIGHVRAKYEELKLYIPPVTDLNVLREREETDRVYTFLAALDPTYEPIRAQILLSTEQLTFDSVTALIRQEATRRVAMGISDSNLKPEAQAFTAQHLSVEKGKSKREVYRCKYCKKDGHTQDKCWVLHPHLRPKRSWEGAKRRMETLESGEGEKRGLLLAKEEHIANNMSQREPDRLDRLESMSALMGQQVGQGKGKPFNPSQICKTKTISSMGREMHNCKTSPFINQILLTNQNSITQIV